MPNHVKSYVAIHGDEAKLNELKSKTLKENDEGAEFDFNGIIPMPDEIKRTGSGSNNAVVDTQEEADKLNAEANKGLLDGIIDTWAITKEENARRLKEYGATNWYEWSCLHWGTKWGAYNVSVIANKPDVLVIEHDTAWSPPTPIWDKLTEQGFTVNAVWQDEDPSNQGEYGDPWEDFGIDYSITVAYLG